MRGIFRFQTGRQSDKSRRGVTIETVLLIYIRFCVICVPQTDASSLLFCNGQCYVPFIENLWFNGCGFYCHLFTACEWTCCHSSNEKFHCDDYTKQCQKICLMPTSDGSAVLVSSWLGLVVQHHYYKSMDTELNRKHFRFPENL